MAQRVVQRSRVGMTIEDELNEIGGDLGRMSADQVRLHREVREIEAAIERLRQMAPERVATVEAQVAKVKLKLKTQSERLALMELKYRQVRNVTGRFN